MRFSIKILLLFVNISIVWSKCDITEEDADKCGMQTEFFGNREVMVPTNDAELNTHCEINRKKLGCVKSFVHECLTGFVKQTMELALNNGAKHMERRCDNPKDREEFLEHVKCMVSKEKMEPFHICADKNMVEMERVLNMEGEDAIGAVCCIFHLFQDCIRQRNKEICGEATTDYWDSVINEIAEDSLTLTCGGFESIDKCQKELKPEVWSIIKEIDGINDAATLASKHTHKSGIALMIDFMKKMKNK